MSFPYLKDLVHAVFGVNLPLPIPMFGLMVAVAFFVGLKIATLEAKRLLPEQPANLMDNAGLIAFFTGLLGARLFHLLEHPREFMADPMAMLLSRGGFTIFGGLIVGTISGLVYCRAKRAPLAPVLDAVAPATMLSYAIGRIGCQIAGDGDWGIAADLAAKPDWLPTWFWAQTYDGNITGLAIPPPGVYPTPIYEVLMGLIAFAVLWRLRKHSHAAGWLFCLYLLLAGVERLAVESIRVNTTYDLAGLVFTQAQLIATVFIIAGCAGMWWLARSRPVGVPPTTPREPTP
jgi:phosphatidylglycerol---prolipoprotein diacylglyceryl transferase